MIENDLLNTTMKNEDVKHYGVLGMKWGVQRPIGSDGLVTGTVKSAKRNLDQIKYTKNKNLKKMTSAELQTTVDRLSKENKLKKLADTREDKRSYRERGNMTDQELNDKVNRLQLESSLKSQAFKANKETFDAVNKVMKEVGTMVVKESNKTTFSENKNTDWMIKQTITQATKKMRDGKTIKTK